MQNMQQNSSKFLRGQASESHQKFVTWLLVVVVEWDGLDAGALILVVEMEAEVDVVILVMVEGMVEGEVGHFLLLLPAGQIRAVVVAMVPSHVIGNADSNFVVWKYLLYLINCIMMLKRPSLTLKQVWQWP